VFFAALLFLSLESSLIGTANAVSMGQSVQAVIPKLASSSQFGLPSFAKANLPAEAHEFIERVKAKIDANPDMMSQPASWENIVSFMELASGIGARGKAAHKVVAEDNNESDNDNDNEVEDKHTLAVHPKPATASKKHGKALEEYMKKTPVQKAMHILEGKTDEDEDDVSDIVESATGEAPPTGEEGKKGMGLVSTVVFFFVLLALVGGIRYLALFLTSRNANVDPIDYMIGTNFTTGSMVAGLVAGFSFSFVDSIVLFWTMILMEPMLSKLPGANEEPAFAAYANIISNLISSAISVSAGAAVSSAMAVRDGERQPFWSQLAGALLGGVIGLMLAKLIPHKTRLRSPPVATETDDQ
jgi:hypothetical protein